MADARQSIIVGAFSTRKQADDAIIALQKAGFPNDQIRHFAGRGERSSLSGIKGIFSSERMARGDVTRDLMDLGIASEDVPFYHQEYEAGHPLVSVAGGRRQQEATSILINHGAYVPQAQRGTTERTSSSTIAQKGAVERTSSSAVTQKPTRSIPAQEQYGNLRDEQHMRLHAEQIQAYKQPAQVGEVVLHKEVVTEQQTIDVPVSREEVVIERRVLANETPATGELMGEDQTIRIPVNEERVNVTKRVVTTGEVVVGKRDHQEIQHFSDTVQREEAHWEQKGDAHIIWEQGTEQPPAQQSGL